MHKFWSTIYSELATTILQHSDKRRKPWPKKLFDVGLTPVEEGFGSEVTLYYPGLYAGSTDLVSSTQWSVKLLLTSSKLIVRRRKNGSKIVCRSQHTLMAHDYVHQSRIEARSYHGMHA